MNGTGTLHSINISSGGVPKRPQRSGFIRRLGLDGDVQRDLRYHGGPDRAVCLYSLDLIHALQGEGHPIAPGSTGENLTIAGLDWRSMIAGVRLAVGEAHLELTTFAAPCRNIRGSFSGGAFGRVSDQSHPGWSRIYARVSREGAVSVGDSVKRLDEDALPGSGLTDLRRQMEKL
jgi:MOSC domain-containing protein YiiM